MVKRANYELKNLILPKIVVEGIIVEKEVKKLGKTGGSSGVIYLPKRFVGEEFQVILIPLKKWDKDTTQESVKL